MDWKDPAQVRKYQCEHMRAWRAKNSGRVREANRRRYWANPEKHREKSRRWYAANPGQNRVWKYGLSKSRYDAMVAFQHGLCAICHQAPERGLYVDHDHTTGHIRGLLCLKCNSAIGLLGDSIEMVEDALEYLRLFGDVARSKSLGTS